MIKTLKYTSKKLFSPILIIILGLTIHFGLSFFLEKKEVLNDVDHQLIIAAGNIRYYLGNDYIKKDIDGTTYAADEAMKKSIFLDRLAKEIGVDFLYLIVKKEDGIYYAITSESLESINESEEPSYYWYNLKDSKDDSYELTRKSFDKKKPTFLNSTDIWGSYRSVYLPQVSDDGTVYLAGADFTTSSLRNKIISRVTLDMLNSVLLLILALPFIFSFQKLLNEREIITKKIHDLDSLDSLTGAYNRNTGLEILKKIIESSKYKGSPLSICLVDIQNLGYINKNMGFSAGDNIIRIVCNILSKNFRQTDKIIRFEGDKFIVILPGCTKYSRGVLVKTLQDKLALFNTENQKDYYLKLHLLFSEYSGDDSDSFIKESFKRFEMHKKKQNSYDFIMQNEILEGLKNGDFKTFLQPKIFSQEKRIEFEALIRWFHPKKGLISPERFIPIAEKSFAIHKITDMVIKDAISTAIEMNTKISVNISPIVFNHPNFIKDMEKIFMNTEHSRFVSLEITEGIALYNFKVALKKMEKLKKMGVEISIDDFGTGYSSLSYLENFPISELKIDKSFIKNIHINKINPLIINFVIRLGEISGFEVIAEGVETEEQIMTLMSLGCCNFQGYYFDKPQSIEAIKEKYFADYYLDMIKNLKN